MGSMYNYTPYSNYLTREKRSPLEDIPIIEDEEDYVKFARDCVMNLEWFDDSTKGPDYLMRNAVIPKKLLYDTGVVSIPCFGYSNEKADFEEFTVNLPAAVLAFTPYSIAMFENFYARDLLEIAFKEMSEEDNFKSSDYRIAILTGNMFADGVTEDFVNKCFSRIFKPTQMHGHLYIRMFEIMVSKYFKSEVFCLIDDLDFKIPSKECYKAMPLVPMIIHKENFTSKNISAEDFDICVFRTNSNIVPVARTIDSRA